MRNALLPKLAAIARRTCRDPELVEDIVQEALLAAVLAGRTDLNALDTARWLTGTVRNQARMAARGASRRRRRDGQWQSGTHSSGAADSIDIKDLLAGLPSALKAVAALALSGHTRREIAWLLNLSDAALRQRVVALKRRLVQAGVAMPADLPGLGLDLAYGRIRDGLMTHLRRGDASSFASHDPDGHLFVIRRSQKPVPRQLEM